MTNTMKKEMDAIGVMVYNANIWGMKSLTVTKPSKETIENIKSLGYQVIDLNNNEVKITW